MSRVNFLVHFPKLNRIFNFALPLWLLFGCLAVVVVASPVCVYFAHNWSKRIVDQARLGSLERENSILKMKMKEFKNLAQRVERNLASLRESDIKLRVLSNLELVHPDVMTLGTGGSSNDSLVTALRNRNASSYSLARDVDGALKHLLEAVRVQEDSYKQLEDRLNQQAHLRDHTPSIWPVHGFMMSGFGYRVDPFTRQLQHHDGIDISGPSGTPIVAPANGKVVFAGPQEGYGLCVHVDHGYGLSTLYGHCSFIKANVGDAIQRGDVIAFTGSTGRSVGPHLHYEVHVAGQQANPLNYIITQTASVD